MGERAYLEAAIEQCKSEIASLKVLADRAKASDTNHDVNAIMCVCVCVCVLLLLLYYLQPN